MADSMSPGRFQRDASPSTTRTSALGRVPTWARNINFDTSFDLDKQASPEFSGYATPSDGPTGLALGGSPQLSDQQGLPTSGSWGRGEPSTMPHSRSPSAGSFPQQPRRSIPHARQPSGNAAPITPSTSSPSITQSDRSTPKALPRANVSSMLPSHQRVASASSATGSTDWLRSPMPPQLHSSADLYAAADSRPGTSMSTVSATFSEDRLDNGAASNGIDKRASVLSFQTARSNGGDYDDGRESQSFASAPASEMEVLDKTLPPKPWLSQGPDAAPSVSSSIYSSIDERHLPPGGWGNAGSWNGGADDARGPSARSSPPAPRRNISAERRSSPSMSPKLRLTSLNEPIITEQPATPSRTPSSTQLLSLSTAQDQRTVRPASMLRNDTTEDVLSTQSLGLTSGPSTLDTPLGPGPGTTFFQQERYVNGQAEPDRQTTKLGTQQAALQPTITESSTPAESIAPAVPEKPSPPTIPSKNEVGLSSPPLSDNVIPTPLPVNANVDVASIPTKMPADRSPVADFRRIPLAAMTRNNDDSEDVGGMARESTTDTVQQPIRPRSASAAGLIAAAGAAASTASAVAGGSMPSSARVGPGIGAHAARHSGADQTAAPAFAALMRRPSNGNAPRVAPPRAVSPTPLDESPSPSIETPPREDSPPPEGEVEARAEWERRQMRQMAEKAKRASGGARKSTFRGQLKPLQLVQHEETKRTGKGSPKRGSPVQLKGAMLPESPREDPRDLSGPSAAGTVSRSASGGSAGLNTMAASNSAGMLASNGKSGGGMSTQQLQRQLARDQRRSVSAVNMAMGQMGVSDIGGAYPVFPSPSASPSIVVGGNRQYPGLMPQRSLVPPFELQNRPDGLPSALIGPDGVRRSPNDPEVCLECMMRDEDMIDVHVLGASLWERESDLDFAEAIRLEGVEDAKREKARAAEAITSNGTDNGTTEGSSTAAAGGGDGEGPVATKEAATAAVGSLSASYPRLTKIRVKRVAKGEPLTAERLKLHTQMNPPASSHRWKTLQTFLAVQAKYIAIEQKARGIAPPAVPPKSAPVFDNAMVKTQSNESRPTQRQRVASPGLFQVEEVPLTAEEKAQKERDIVGAREARRRNNASLGQVSATDPAMVAEDAAENRLSGPPVVNDNSSGHHSIPRRSNAGPSPYVRAGSIQDLRTLPSAMAAKKDTLQPIAIASNNNLAPPHAAFRGPPSPHSPRGIGSSRMRTVSSQMSLANSGSMIDMHVGLENSKEHRIAQAGFMPGTPLHSQSPGAMNRAFYGFPGDGEAEHGETWSIGRGIDQSMGASFGEYDESYRSSPELDRRKKKSSGLRGFFGKIAGKEGGELRPEDESMDSRDRRYSMRPDSSLELQPPPGIGGLLSRARRSTSSLLMPSGRQSMDSTMMLGGGRGFSNPLMASQTSLEMGPFGSGPLPPPRKDSKLPASSPAPKDKEKSLSRLRAFSSGNLIGKKKNPPAPTSRTSSMMQNNNAPQNNGIPVSPSGEQDPYDRGNSASRLSNRRDLPSAISTRDISSPSLRGRDQYPSQDRQAPPSAQAMQNNGPQSQFRNPFPLGMNRSDVYLPGSVASDLRDESGNPLRPPRNPSRVSMSLASSEHPVEYMDGAAQNKSTQPLHIPTSLQKEQFYHSYDTPPTPEAAPRMRDQRQEQQQQQQRTSTFGFAGQPPAQPPSPASPPLRKSKLLKLPFGKNKRESAALSIATTKETNSLKSRSSRATFDDNAAYYAAPSPHAPNSYQQPGFDSLRTNDAARPRYDSNPSYDFPPRSQSAMGILDANQAQGQTNGLRGFFPRLRTNSRAALREVQED